MENLTGMLVSLYNIDLIWFIQSVVIMWLSITCFCIFYTVNILLNFIDNTSQIVNKDQTNNEENILDKAEVSNHCNFIEY